MSKARKLWFGLAMAIGSLAASASYAVDCKRIQYDDNLYTACTVDARTEEIRVFRAAASGEPYGHFQALDTALTDQQQQLTFAMNGGMYHEDRAPVGHYIEDGKTQMRVISNPGPGNFGLLPNGILCIRDTRTDVFETRAYLARKPGCTHATQSGPMLVIDGELHPRFLANSTSRYIRNGVGTSADGTRATFVISDNTVTFHEFARLFRDGLKLPNALFLDGNVSRIHAPQLGRSDLGRAMGPIIAVTAPLN
ncbi:MAG: phosphodiester glycosidase family protein [Pelagimonas sp.]|jgi:uncharacterized protein YigE (DUF2233 family)|nr:phosphodiester glycosidase family protein [Pelagimonas sp.]